MARLDQISFDTYTDEWLQRRGPDAVPLLSVSAPPGNITAAGAAKTGPYCVRLRGTDVPAYIRCLDLIPGSPDELWLAFHFKNDTTSSWWRESARIYTDGVDLIFETRPNSLSRVDYNGTEYSTDTVMTGNIWFHVEMHLKMHATLGEFHVWINGVLEVSEEGIDTTLGGATLIERWRIVTDNISTSNTIESYFDNVIIQDDSGASDNGRIGVRYLEPVRSNASGDLSQWGLFPDTGESDWEDIDDVAPNDDTDYLHEDTDGQQFLVNLADWDATGKTPLKVHVTSIAKREGGTAADAIKLLAKSGATTAKSASCELADGTYRFNLFTLHDDPDGGSWLEAGIDGLQIGAECFDVP